MILKITSFKEIFFPHNIENVVSYIIVMSHTRWTKEGRRVKESCPSAFSSRTGFTPRGKGGPHKNDNDYSRSNKRNEERQVKREFGG